LQWAGWRGGGVAEGGARRAMGDVIIVC
jgi:hypothetical protein